MSEIKFLILHPIIDPPAMLCSHGFRRKPLNVRRFVNLTRSREARKYDALSSYQKLALEFARYSPSGDFTTRNLAISGDGPFAAAAYSGGGYYGGQPCWILYLYPDEETALKDQTWSKDGYDQASYIGRLAEKVAKMRGERAGGVQP